MFVTGFAAIQPRGDFAPPHLIGELAAGGLSALHHFNK
jgi:hypothetical protein